MNKQQVHALDVACVDIAKGFRAIEVAMKGSHEWDSRMGRHIKTLRDTMWIVIDRIHDELPDTEEDES